MLYLRWLYALNRAVTTSLGYDQKLNKAVNRPNFKRAVFRNTGRAVKISVHYTALYMAPHCIGYEITTKQARQLKKREKKKKRNENNQNEVITKQVQ